MSKIIQGEAKGELKKLPDESVDMVITSPPYWNLRDYNVEGQLGLEPHFEEYIQKLCGIFDEVKRVLKKEGTCWVNMGDTYAGTMPKTAKDVGHNAKVAKGFKNAFSQRGTLNQSVQNKSLCQIPARFAIEMTSRGWILRNEIIWKKPNAMPSSAKDRFTVDFESLFFFVKSKKYYFNQQFEDYAPASDVRYRQALRANRSYNTKEPYKNNTPYSGKFKNNKEHEKYESPRARTQRYKRGTGSVSSRGEDADGLVVGGHNPKGRNKRTVWEIPTKPFPEAHFAVFPEALCEIPVKAGSPKGGVVLDPFSGASTTGVVAQKLGRKYIGIELNPEYIKIAKNRLKQKNLL